MIHQAAMIKQLIFYTIQTFVITPSSVDAELILKVDPTRLLTSIIKKSKSPAMKGTTFYSFVSNVSGIKIE